jgi:uncharacterized membrane protein
MIAAILDPYVRDWLDLLLRWLHVIAAVVWIGTSFYFVALDSHLLPPRRTDEDVGGEAWEIHGGGFYRVQRWRGAPATLPEPLHWFKWEAYGTWLSGFALLVVLYYLDPQTYLLDRSVSDISSGEAVAISAALLVVGWLVYDGLCQLLRGHDLWLAAALTALVAATAYGLGEVFSGRAVWLQTGAMLGTIMVANVFFVIIPAHRDLIAAKEAGEEPDPAPAREATRRSVHNNYLTLPVLLAMLGNHFAFATGNDQGWLILVLLMAIGAWTRHFYNLRHRGRSVWLIPVAAGIAVLVVAAAVKPEETTVASGERVSFATAQSIVERRCTPCHSTNPSRSGFDAPPKGIVLETAAQIVAMADAIEQQAVDSRAMPLGNVTGMTDAERAQLGAWIAAGARAR